MPFNNGRFALLVVFCGLAAQSFSPFGGVGIRAAVLHRQPNAVQVNQYARHDNGETADYDIGDLHDDQASFSFPWSRRKDAPLKRFTEVRVPVAVSQRNHQKKRSIAISNVHGAKYVIKHRRQASTPQWISAPRNGTLFNNTASTSSSPDGMPGTVAIVSRNPNPNNDRVLASLFLIKQQDGGYVLDASDRNATELFLMAVPTASSSDMSASASDTYPVKLAIPLEDGPYCATYDQAPPNPEPLTAQRCTENSVRTGHTSQIFMYNTSSGVVQPTYFVEQNVDAKDVGTPSASPLAPSPASPSVSMAAANAGVAASSDSSPTPSASASSASWSRRDDGASFGAQNVTLVFVPKKVASNAAAAAVQEVSTSTVTQTVIVFSSAASPSGSVVNAADATPSPASVASSSGSAATAGVTGLSVEVVGNGLSSAPSAAFSRVGMVAAASGSGQRAPSPSASNSPSPSMDAAAVVASYSVASTTSPAPPSLSAAAVGGVASVSPSDNSAAAPASSSAGTLFERNAAKVTPVSTEPYLWRFKAEGRF